MNKIGPQSFFVQSFKYGFPSGLVRHNSEQDRTGACEVDASGSCFQQAGTILGEPGEEIEGDLLEDIEEECFVYVPPMIQVGN